MFTGKYADLFYSLLIFVSLFASEREDWKISAAD